MKHGSRRAKARRLQVAVAEELARALGLTVEAQWPTRPGRRKGVRWVPEGAGGDLRVRVMGQPGPDVALLTARARSRVAYLGRALVIECKNTEAWGLDARFWRGEAPQLFWRALAQASARGSRLFARELPLVVVGRNRWPPVAVCAWPSFKWAKAQGPLAVFNRRPGEPPLVAMPLRHLVGHLDGSLEGD